MKNTNEKKTKNPEVATVSHANHRQRLFETIANIGLDNTNDVIALEFILTYVLPRVDTNPIAHRLLDKFGNISAVLDASIEELQSVRGMGEQSAKMLSMLPQIFWRYNKDHIKNCKILTTKGTMLEYCSSLLLNKPNEELYAICLNKNYKVVAVKLLSKGSVNTLTIEAPDFLRTILSVPNVAKIILTHSHPDGSCKPSKEDIGATDKFTFLLAAVGIELIEHIIVGAEMCYTIKEERAYEL